MTNPVGLSITQLVLHAYSTDNPIKAMSACIICIKAMSSLSIIVIGNLILYIDMHKARSPGKHKYPLFSLTGEEENNTQVNCIHPEPNSISS
jgi:hypothetical protein